MPLPLPHFGEIDPLLTTIKTGLYYYDEYQTYDLIMIDFPTIKIAELITQYLNYPHFDKSNCWISLFKKEGFNNYCLIERFIPKKASWASEYSKIIYNNFKKFAGTGLNDNPYLSGKNHPYAYLFDFQENIINSDINENWLTLNIPIHNKSGNITFSWFEYGFKTSQTPEYIRKSESFNINAQTTNIQLKFNYIQPCSMVIGGDADLISQIKPLIPTIYLYENLTEIISDLILKIESANPYLYYFLGKLKISGNVNFSVVNANRSTTANFDFLPITFDDFIPIPETLKKSCLIYANNNYWGDNSPPEDTGDILFFYDENNPYMTLQPELSVAYDDLFYYNSWGNLYPLYGILEQSGYIFAIGDGLRRSTNSNKSYLSVAFAGLSQEYYIVDFPFSAYSNNLQKANFLKNYISQSLFYNNRIGFLKLPLILAKFIQNTNDIPLNYELKKYQGIVNQSGDLIEPHHQETILFSNDSSNTNWSFSYPLELIYEYDLSPRDLSFLNNLDENSFINFTDSQKHYSEILINGETTMPDSIRIKEIHESFNQLKYALEADTYAYADPTDPENSDRRVANLGYYIERIARVLGISVNPDGSVRSIRQSKFVKQGDEIPAGWSIGQWGRNQGGNTEGQRGGDIAEDRDGLAYEVRSNKFTVNPFSGEATAIEQGGYVLVENIPQLLHIILSDLDKALGWAEAGANVLPNPNNPAKPIPYEGLNTLLAEVAFMLSQLSRNITGTHISALKNQGMLHELIAHQGVATGLKQIEVDIGTEDPAKLVYPALGGASNFEQSALILANLSLLIGNILKQKEENNNG